MQRSKGKRIIFFLQYIDTHPLFKGKRKFLETVNALTINRGGYMIFD